MQTALPLEQAEIGDFERFAPAEQFASHIGIVSQDGSRGQKKHILERKKGQSPDIIAHTDRGSENIRQKLAGMDNHGKQNV